jgi:hypothetical protein
MQYRPVGGKLRSDVIYAPQHGLRRDNQRVPIQEGSVSAARYIDALLKSNPQETSGQLGEVVQAHGIIVRCLQILRPEASARHPHGQ